VNMLDPLPYEVPEEIIPERRSTNDDGTDFN
jgi:topoisomerase-4 subunit A